MAKKLTIMLFLGTILSLLTIYILKTYNNYKLDTNNIMVDNMRLGTLNKSPPYV